LERNSERCIGGYVLEVNLFDHVNQTLEMAEKIGVLLVSVGSDGRPNVMTIGWLLLGRSYHENPIAVVAVRPARYTFKLLDEIEEFVISVPGPELEKAVTFCGEKSGRDLDKFKEAGLTPIPSVHVRAPSIKECIINIECRIYNKVRPPHYILTPQHRKATVSEQHTIYFAEVLGTYK
jgi:flavin reductase (DIM6/NTAB) family NADH-FMN oxidoreductase RutF